MGQCASCAAPPRADDAVDDGLGGESRGTRRSTPPAIPAGGAQQRGQRQRLKNQKSVDKRRGGGGGGAGGEAEHPASDGGGASGCRRSSRGRFLSRRDTPLPTNSRNTKKAALERSIWEEDIYYGARSDTRGGGRVGRGVGGRSDDGGGGDGKETGEDVPPLTLLEASARRVARHYQASRGGDQERIYAKLRSFAKTMPQRAASSSSSSSSSHNKKLEIPVAPRVLAEAAEAAMHGCDNEWARRDAVADLLAVDIVYNTMDGKRVLGKEAVIDKMNDTMEKMTKRLRRSSTRGDGKNMRHLKMRSEGPTYAGSGVWLMSYTFEMMLMKIRVREEFVMDDRGMIKELTRIRM